MAALGCVVELSASGADRFKEVARAWRTLVAGAVCRHLGRTACSGLVAVGGFAFAPDGVQSRRWQGFSPASMIVPELSLARRAARRG